NPCLQVKHPSKEHQRERILSDEEIRGVWATCDRPDPLHAPYFQWPLLPPQRGGEVRSMRWEDTDLETGWWTIPGSRAKNGLTHRVPLSPLAMALLRGIQTTPAASPWIFPRPIRPQQPLGKP